MRGSIKWQVNQLVQTIFEQKISKQDRRDQRSDKFNKITQNTTMQTYKLIWIEIGNYLKKYFDINDMELLTNKNIEAYLNYKISLGIAKQTLEKIISAVGKLEFTLSLYSKKNKTYNFNSRLKILNYARDFSLVYDGYHNRSYINASKIIASITNEKYQLAAKLQYEGGARIGGIEYLKNEISITYDKLVINQLIDKISINKLYKKKAYLSHLQGIIEDPILLQKNIIKKVGLILTIEKGGKPGLIYVSPDTYKKLEEFIKIDNIFHIDRFAYIKIIQNVCETLGYDTEGSHGFRWTHIQNRQKEMIMAGFSIDEAMLINSIEHKHWRKEITGHYLGA